jgi:hypothetical protein
MNKVISRLKNIRPFKIVTVFLAGILLLFTQACGSVEAKTPTGGMANPTVGRQSAEPNSEVYVPKGANVTSPYQGGMNNFSDVDPRSKTGTKVESEALKENAERNIEQKSVDSLEQYGQNFQQGTPLGERVKRIGEDVKSSTEELTEGLSEGTQRGIENIKKNTKDATEDLSKNVQRSAEDIKLNAQRTAEDAGDAVNQMVRSADSNVKSSAKETGEKVQKVAESAKALIQAKTTETANSAQSNLEKVKDAVDK